MYYAMYSPYGTKTISHDDTLLKFESKRKRDHWVNSEVFNGSNYQRSALTRDEARKIFPEAFKNKDDFLYYMDNDPYYHDMWHGNIWFGSRRF